MEKERLAEYLERYHLGAANAATSWELECAFGVRGKDLRDAVNGLRRQGVPVETGVFGAHMEIEMAAWGPITILMDTEQMGH